MGLRNSKVAMSFALQTADLGSIPSTPYSPQALLGAIPSTESEVSP